MENLKIKAQKYLQKVNKNWKEITRVGYLCYENDLELANEIIYKLFEKDVFNDMATYYRETSKNDNGYIFKVLCELEENIYFQFDIITRYGIDIPQKISNGKFRIMRNLPKGWKNIWDLWKTLQNEEK